MCFMFDQILFRPIFGWVALSLLMGCSNSLPLIPQTPSEAEKKESIAEITKFMTDKKVRYVTDEEICTKLRNLNATKHNPLNVLMAHGVIAWIDSEGMFQTDRNYNFKTGEKLISKGSHILCSHPEKREGEYLPFSCSRILTPEGDDFRISGYIVSLDGALGLKGTPSKQGIKIEPAVEAKAYITEVKGYDIPFIKFISYKDCETN
jgi:hypothetical protein